MMNREDYVKQIPDYQYMRETVKKDENRLHFHLMPPTGWMNDPNGLCEFQGINHIYFQYTPFLAGWGTKLWGHYTTTDWIHFQECEPFLFPDCGWDRDGVYSGSAFVDGDKIHYFYTGNVKLQDKDYDYILEGREQNTIHLVSEDGVHAGEKQLVMTNSDYPADMSKHVRDPKIFAKNGRYYMVQGARDCESKGCVLLFESEDLMTWKYFDRIAPEEKFGYMWECPDYFKVEGHPVFAFSPQGIEAEEYRFANIYQSGYLADVRLPDTSQIRDIYKKFREWDLGFDFYAPQTLEAPDGRRILFGWAGVSDSPYDNEPSIREGWQHSMTVPRELSWKGGILCQKPVRELEALRKDEIVFEQGEAEIHGGAFDLVAERDIAGEIPVCICFNQELQITYGHGVVSMGFLNNTGSGRTIRKAKLDGLQNVRILMDVSLMEVYFNDGELVMTTRYYPEDPMTTKVSISGMEQVKGWTMAGQ